MYSLLAALNLLIALGYYSIAGLIIIAPLKASWIRSLGVLWFTTAAFSVLFFAGCGTHHLDMFFHLLADPSFIDPGDLWHFLVIDGVQPGAALVVAGTLILKGGALIERLLETLVRKRPELIDRLARRLEKRSG
jgi:hypothetical protein